MKKILDWLTWLLWTSEIVFLAASTPHIATYFYHFDNPTNIWTQVYAWGVGYGLALTLDGVSFVVLMSLVVAIKYKRPWWLTTFLVFALLLISSLSWFMNWQYDIVFGASSFAKADGIKTFAGWTIGSLNPIIGGAFPFLSVLYALVAKALEVDESDLIKPAMTPEQFEAEKLRLKQEQELKELKAAQRNGKGLLSIAQEAVMGKSRTSQELLQEALQMLREAPLLVQVTSQEEALQALVSHLRISDKQAQGLLIEARSIVQKELDNQRKEEEKRVCDENLRREKEAEERRLEQIRLDHNAALERERLAQEAETERLRLEQEADLEKARLVQKPDHERIISQMSGRDSVSIEEAGNILGYTTKYIVRLRNEGTLKSPSKRPEQITVASLRAYQASHKRRDTGYSNGHTQDTEALSLSELHI